MYLTNNNNKGGTMTNVIDISSIIAKMVNQTML